jgi:tetratricopeptide (TPR) repeat protein
MLQDERGLIAWAEREYQQVLKNAPAGSVPEFRGRFYLSELLHDQGREQAAGETLKPVCDLMEKDEAARQTCEKARRLPDGVISRMHYFFACHFHETGDAQKEREHLEKAVAANEEDADVLIAMYRLPGADEAWKRNTKERIQAAAARAMEEIKAHEMIVDRAENEAQRAAAGEDLSVLCNEYAWLVGNTFGNYDEAIKRSRQSLELRPNYYGYLDTLGRCYFTKGDLANALKYQTLAVKGNPYSGQLRRQLELFQKEAAAKGVELPDELKPGAGSP